MWGVQGLNFVLCYNCSADTHAHRLLHSRLLWAYQEMPLTEVIDVAMFKTAGPAFFSKHRSDAEVYAFDHIVFLSKTEFAWTGEIICTAALAHGKENPRKGPQGAPEGR